MVERSKVRITVYRKLKIGEVFGKQTPAIMKQIQVAEEDCPRLKAGQEFHVMEDGQMPAGFCSPAWHDIHRELTHLRFGGDFPWMAEPGIVYACCTDALRPVILKLQRIK